MLPTSTSILIIGAGPAGLSCALSLITNGVKPQDITIVDAQAQGLNSSRAIVIHAKTLEELDTVGCSDNLVSEGNANQALSVCSGRTTLVQADFPTLAGRTRFPFALIISQTETERILEERLAELGLSVQRPYRMSNLKGVDDGIEVSFENGVMIKTAFLVAADGSRSMVRTLSGIGFKDPGTGEDPHSDSVRNASHKEKPLAIADVHFVDDVSPSLSDKVYLGPRGLFLFFRLSNPSVQKPIYRLACLMEPGTKDITKDVLQNTFQIGLELPRSQTPVIESAIFSSAFHVRFAVADQLYKGIGGGAIALVGDAAHIHSPAGGQGMNLGIRDAIDLGRILTNILSDPTRSDALEVLERYSTERRSLALQTIKMTKTLTRFVLVENVLIRKVRNMIMWTLGRFPGFGGRLAYNLSGLR